MELPHWYRECEIISRTERGYRINYGCCSFVADQYRTADESMRSAGANGCRCRCVSAELLVKSYRIAPSDFLNFLVWSLIDPTVNETRIKRQGGVELILWVMGRHPSHAQLHEQARTALRALHLTDERMWHPWGQLIIYFIFSTMCIVYHFKVTRWFLCNITYYNRTVLID